MTTPLENFAPADDDWTERALCRQTDPEAFYPARNTASEVGPALSTCTACPVAADCLAYALEHDERFGIWGGTTPSQRRALLKRKTTEA